MDTEYILRKELNNLLCRHILGCIGPSEQMNSLTNAKIIRSIEQKLGPIAEILPSEPLINPPKTYFQEAGNKPLSTAIFVLEKKGSYTDLHHLKHATSDIEAHFLTITGRTFNLNPGTVGRYGVCLASHKSTGGRSEISTYAYGNHPVLFLFGKSETYYERIMRWEDGNLIPMISKDKFPEYFINSRVRCFERLIVNLSQTENSVELYSN